MSPSGSARPRAAGIPGLRAFAALAIGVAAATWLAPLGSSLWLDETGTAWVIEEGPSEAVRRSLEVQGQSPAYYVIVAAFRAVGGAGEAALRLPSVLAAAGGAILLYRIGVRLFGRETGVLAALAFVGLQNVVFAATDARPYALALAASLGALLAFARWLEERRGVDGISAVLFAALTVYLHYAFALSFVAHALLLGRRGRRIPWRAISLGTLATGALLLPLAPQFVSLLERGEDLSFAGAPSARAVLEVLALPALVGVAGLVLGRLDRARRAGLDPAAASGHPTQDRVRREDVHASFIRLPGWVIAWAVAPPLVILLVSWLTPVELFVPRYFLPSVPAVALLVGWALRRVGPVSVRVGLAGMLAIASVASFARTAHAPDDWRSAISAANSLAGGRASTVLLRSGFVEARRPEWLADPARRGFLLAPLAAYHLAAPAVAVPFDLRGETQPYFRDILTKAMVRSERLILVTSLAGAAFDPWIARELAPAGFEGGARHRFGSLLQIGRAHV